MLLTSIEVVLLGYDLAPVLGALRRQLLRFIKAADGEGLDVLVEGFVAHLLHVLLHGLEKGLHPRLEVVRGFLRLDDKTKPLHAVRPAWATEHDVA